MSSVKITDEYLREYSDTHLLYEVQMLVDTAHQLASYSVVNRNAGNDAWATRNALLESFLIHARNLKFFFCHKPKEDDISAWQYDDQWSFPSMCPETRTMYAQMSKRLAHLTSKRPLPEEGPPTPWDCKTITKRLVECLKMFVDRVPGNRLGREFRAYVAEHQDTNAMTFPVAPVTTAAYPGRMVVYTYDRRD
jgi:hypothetical protein